MAERVCCRCAEGGASERLLQFALSKATVAREIAADGNRAITDETRVYEGLGMVSANNSSRLLLDYKWENPKTYWKLLNDMFGKDGIGISLIKIEMGADVDSSSGTEPAVMRAAEEKADVTRGAGYQLAADAQTINPELKIDLLFWGIPGWAARAADPYAAMYQWYKATIDAMYDTYGLKVTHVTVTQNEKPVDTEWIKYFHRAFRAETKGRYDYGTIRIVAGEAVGTWEIADQMLEDPTLMEAVDVVTAHYTSWTSDNVKTLQRAYGKNVWFSEGSPPMRHASAVCRYDGTGSGISGENGMLDIASRITQGMTEGMTLYEFQPVISSYYSGVTYFPKQLITANEPWSGAYSFDPGFYMALHFSRFIETGWQFVEGACYGDGKAGGDGHAVVDSTFNYITCVDQTRENCSVVLVNPSAETIRYDIRLSNLSCQGKKLWVWETRGPEDGGGYDANFFRKLGYVLPDGGIATVVMLPYSMMTVTTVDREEMTYEEAASEVLRLPYADDFQYRDYAKNYLMSRGGAPRYTTDQGGAFEVENAPEGNVLMQKITCDNLPVDWDKTSDPVTNLGDDRWSNYAAALDIHFADNPVECAAVNYVGLGIRYNLADRDISGYWIRLEETGKCCLMKDEEILSERLLDGFESGGWHTLRLEALHNTIVCGVDGERVIRYEDTQSVVNSGRAAIYSAYQRNYFGRLKITPLEGHASCVARLDDLDAAVVYSAGSCAEGEGGWYHDTMCSYRNYNRTLSKGRKGDWLEFSYSGGGFALLGDSSGAVIRVEIDGSTAEEGYCCTGDVRKASYYHYHLKSGAHHVRITVLDGIFELDAIEYETKE